MFESSYTVFFIVSVLITKRLQIENVVKGKVEDSNGALILGPRNINLSPSLQLILTMRTTMSKQKGPVCRERLVLLYLCMLLLQESYAPEPNPGPRPPKFPCGVCQKAVKWTTPGVQCDSCKLWYHQDCMGMCDGVYLALRNVSWHCVQCGLPNFSSCLFDLTFYESANTFDPLQLD